jgi:hypothetical protein
VELRVLENFWKENKTKGGGGLVKQSKKVRSRGAVMKG